MTDLKDNLDSAYSNLYSLSQDFGYILNLINIKIIGVKNKVFINLAANISSKILNSSLPYLFIYFLAFYNLIFWEKIFSISSFVKLNFFLLLSE